MLGLMCILVIPILGSVWIVNCRAGYVGLIRIQVDPFAFVAIASVLEQVFDHSVYYYFLLIIN